MEGKHFEESSSIGGITSAENTFHDEVSSGSMFDRRQSNHSEAWSFSQMKNEHHQPDKTSKKSLDEQQGEENANSTNAKLASPLRRSSSFSSCWLDSSSFDMGWLECDKPRHHTSEKIPLVHEPLPSSTSARRSSSLTLASIAMPLQLNRNQNIRQTLQPGAQRVRGNSTISLSLDHDDSATTFGVGTVVIGGDIEQPSNASVGPCLVTANLVVEESEKSSPFVEASLFEDTASRAFQSLLRHKKIQFVLMAVFILFGGLVVATVFGLSTRQRQEPTTSSPMTVSGIISSPSTENNVEMPVPYLPEGFLETLPTFLTSTSQNALVDPTSPQSRALVWLKSIPEHKNFTANELLQRFALATIFYATSGSFWDKNSGWVGAAGIQHECSWFFVVPPASAAIVTTGRQQAVSGPCVQNSTSYRILSLPGNGLRGSIPDEIGLLSELEYVDLSHNSLVRNIPTTFGRLSHLKVLNLNHNLLLDGSIPTELMQLSQLKILSASSVLLSGGLPLNRLHKMTSLAELNFSRSAINGTIPSEISLSRTLRVLDLSETAISGTIPSDVALLTNLQHLALDNARLAGPLPNQMINLSEALTHFTACCNELDGTIPHEIGKMTSLTRLDLTANSLTGTLPTSIGQLQALSFLSLNKNKLNGTLPHHLAFLERKLEHLLLGSNFLKGTLPRSFGLLRHLIEFHVHENKLVGQVPSHYGSMTSLEQLYLYSNELSGPMPRALCQLTNLVENGGLAVDCQRHDGCKCCVSLPPVSQNCLAFAN